MIVFGSHADADYWGLTTRQRIHFFGRIAQYYSRQADHHAALARWHADRSVRLSRITMWLMGAAVVLAVVSFVVKALTGG